MGVIPAHRGAQPRTPSEIKRDFEYCAARGGKRVRDLTLQSTAPTLVYEEGSLVKRSIRDLYNKDIDEVVVAGDAAYKGSQGLHAHAHAEPCEECESSIAIRSRSSRATPSRASSMRCSPDRAIALRRIHIVLNQTEALVAIDVNSRCATREHHIEDTALKTNLEASEEIARQLRLRDLAGLVVIDFIDMDEKRNNRSVERRLKDALKNDRARIQVGRISHFGLMEMSRAAHSHQRAGSSTDKCPTCGGTRTRAFSIVAWRSSFCASLTSRCCAVEHIILSCGPARTWRSTSSITSVATCVIWSSVSRSRSRVSADAGMNPQQPFLIEKGELVHSPDQARADCGPGCYIRTGCRRGS